MSRCEDEQMWRWEGVKMGRCEDEQMWRWEGVKMRGCEDEQMWRWEGVKMGRCEDEQMWRWEGVKMSRCEDERMWRWEDVKMSRCEDERMWRWQDVKMKRCEDERMWRWEDVKMKRCEDERMWRWDVKMRCEDEKMFYRPPLLEEPCGRSREKSLKPLQKPKPTISSPRKKTESASWICSYLAQHIMWLRPWAIGILSPTGQRQPFIIYIIKPKAAQQGAANASAWECWKNSIHNH